MTDTELRTVTTTRSKMNDNNDNGHILTSSLPENFMSSMRRLFDILDDKHVGYVPLSEIERQWRDDAVPNLPGVVDSLKSIEPVDGLIDFETFVWGLKIAFARSRQNGQLKSSLAKQLKTIQNPDLGNLTQKLQDFRKLYKVDGNNDRDVEIKHKRSSSGPVGNSEVIPNWKPEFFTEDLLQKYGKMDPDKKVCKQQRQNGAACRLPLNENLERIKLSSATANCDFTASQPSTNCNRFVLTRSAAVNENQKDRPHKFADVLCLKPDRGQSAGMQPIDLAGRMIGVTGSAQTANCFTVNSHYYGSLKRPAMSTPYKFSSSNLKIRKSPADDCKLRHRYNQTNHNSATTLHDGGGCVVQDSKCFKSKRCLSMGKQACVANTTVNSSSNLEKEGKEQRIKCATSISPTTEQLNDSVFLTSTKQLSTSPHAARSKSNGGPCLDIDTEVEFQAERKEKSSSKHKERRRHTLANGVDYSMLKYMGQVNEEKKLIVRGLQLLKSTQKLFENCLDKLEQRSNGLRRTDKRFEPFTQTLTNDDLESLTIKFNDIAALIQQVTGSGLPKDCRSSETPELNNKAAKKESDLKKENEMLKKEILNQEKKLSQLQREKSLIIQQLFHVKAELQLLKPMSNNPSIFL